MTLEQRRSGDYQPQGGKAEGQAATLMRHSTIGTKNAVDEVLTNEIHMASWGTLAFLKPLHSRSGVSLHSMR